MKVFKKVTLAYAHYFLLSTIILHSYGFNTNIAVKENISAYDFNGQDNEL